MFIKKAVAVAVVLVLGIFSAAAAQIQMSAGISGSFDMKSGGGVSIKPVSGRSDGDAVSAQPWTGGGVNAFLDLTYAEIGVGLTFADMDYTINGEQPDIGDEPPYSVMFLDLGLMGKYPVVLDNITIFPMLGVEYKLGLSAKLDGEELGLNGEKLGDELSGDKLAPELNQVWLRLGAGADIALSDAVFIRPAVMYGLGFANKYNSNIAKFADAMFNGMMGVKIVDVKATLSHAFTAKVGVGFKF